VTGWTARLLAWDKVTSARLAGSAGGRLAHLLALLVAHSGDSPLWLVGGGAALLWGGATTRPFGLRILIATLAGALAATLGKWLFRRNRPGASHGGLYTRLDRHAFPSGHATRAACVAVILAPLLPPWVAALLAAWAVAVCLARVALRVHYLLDVAAGLLLGVVLGVAFLLLGV